ncbi:MAG: entericidin [Pseudomonadota bacterium]
MKKIIVAFGALAALTVLSACNTFYGLGEDIEAAGKGLQSGSEAVEDELTGGL